MLREPALGLCSLTYFVNDAQGGGAEAAAEGGVAAEGVWYAVGRRGGGNSELVG